MTNPDTPSKSAASGSGSQSSQAPLNPGDDAPPGTPGTGEALCRRCGGSGKDNGQTCPECNGTGRVIQGVGGA